MIRASGGMGKNSGICYHTTYNDNSMQSEIIYFWNFPIQYFKPWLVTVAETLEHKMVGNKVVSVSPEVSTMLFLLEIPFSARHFCMALLYPSDSKANWLPNTTQTAGVNVKQLESCEPIAKSGNSNSGNHTALRYLHTCFSH